MRGMSKTKRVQESFQQLSGTPEDGVLRDCLLVGIRSRNGRNYPVAVLESAKPLYEGRKIFVDHNYDGGKRKIRERWAMAKDVRVDETGLRGDVHYLESHAATPSILEAIAKFDDIGFSHDADIALDGQGNCKEIAHVYSIDIVNDPATTKNVREEHEPMKKATLGAVLRANLGNKPAATMLARVTEMEDDALMLDDEIDVSTDDMVGDDAISEAFKAAVTAILDQDGTIQEKITKIQAILNAQAEVTGENTAEGDGAGADSKAMEELQLKLTAADAELAKTKRALESLQVEGECQRLLESSKREVTPARVKALAAIPAADRNDLVAEWPEKSSRPSSSPSKVLEEDNGDIPNDVAGLKKLLGVGRTTA